MTVEREFEDLTLKVEGTMTGRWISLEIPGYYQDGTSFEVAQSNTVETNPGGSAAPAWEPTECAGELWAYAQLFAAAPKLLIELNEIVDGWEQIEKGKVRGRRLTAWEEERLEFARSAIFSATGQAAKS